MPYVRVKQKHQVTIPRDIRQKVDLQEGDTLEAVVKDGNIILIPQLLSRKSQVKSRPSLLSLMGKNKGSGLYRDAAHVDDYIGNLRDEWN